MQLIAFCTICSNFATNLEKRAPDFNGKAKDLTRSPIEIPPVNLACRLRACLGR